MPECKSPLREELKAYVDGELSAGERARVEKHLKSCDTCQAELASLQQLTKTFATVFSEPAPLPAALRARILSQLPEPAPARPLPFWRRRGPQALGGGVLAFACAVWLWGRVPQEALQEKALSSATASAPVVLPAPEVAQDRAKELPQAAPTPEAATANRAMARGEVFASKGAPRLASPPAPPVHLADSPKKEEAPAPSESRLTFGGAPSKPMAPPLASSGVPTGGGGIPGSGSMAGNGRGGFGGGGFKAKAVLAPITELTLTVAAGKVDATVTELKKQIEELGGSATVTEKPKKLTVTLPSEKALQLRSQLETLGKVVPSLKEGKRDVGIESLEITVQEESGN